MKFSTVLRIALALGFLIDGSVGLIALFAPRLVEPLFDIPAKDLVGLQFLGAEFVVVALVYALAFRDPRRFAALLWICALDQLFAVVLPSIEVARGVFPASWKVVGPIPVSALLVLVLAAGALRNRAARSPR